MTSPKKKVAIIGGGLSGMGSIIVTRQEGMEPVCFEKTANYGGTWYYREKPIDGIASIMPTTTLNNTKEMGAFSNFPPKKESSNYMSHKEFYQYITESANHNDVLKYIHYNSEVIQVKMADDYEETGRWSVTVKNTLSGELTTDVYNYVIVANGHFNTPKMPSYPNQKSFRGKIMHTHDLKEVTEFKGKKVVIVGIGCSALDAAVDISNVAEQVYLSTRSGAYIIPRLGPNGYPFDYTLCRRYITMLLDILPTNLTSWYIETFYLDKKFDHKLYAVQPKYHVLSKDPSLNDIIGIKLVSGRVIQKQDIESFTEQGVIFCGETEVTEVDCIVMGTGYDYKFPFLPEGIPKIDNGMIHLYKCVFPTQLAHPTLAFIGFINPFGPGIPAGELQARWIAQIFAGNCQLPSEEKMIEDVKRRHRKNEKRYTPSDLMTVRVDIVQYMDEIATEIGAKPNFLKMFFTDIRLFCRLIFGPCVPYQYRLVGPHKWEGAREAIMTCDERVFWPLCKGKKVPKGFVQIILEYIANLVPTNFYLLRV